MIAKAWRGPTTPLGETKNKSLAHWHYNSRMNVSHFKMTESSTLGWCGNNGSVTSNDLTRVSIESWASPPTQKSLLPTSLSPLLDLDLSLLVNITTIETRNLFSSLPHYASFYQTILLLILLPFYPQLSICRCCNVCSYNLNTIFINEEW